MKSEDQEPREDLPILLTSREVAVALKVSKSTLCRCRHTPEPDVSPVSTQ